MNTQQAPNCPICGSPMVLRHSKKDGSPFWGCSHYPDCTGTLPAEGGAKRTFKATNKFEKIEQLAKEKNERIQRLHNEKREDINWISSWKLSEDFVKNNELYKNLDAEALREQIEEWQDWFYQRISQQKTKNETFEEPEEGDSLDSLEEAYN